MYDKIFIEMKIDDAYTFSVLTFLIFQEMALYFVILTYYFTSSKTGADAKYPSNAGLMNLSRDAF